MLRRHYNDRYTPNDIEAKKAAYVQINEETGCWEWTGQTGRGGYGNCHWHGHNLQAHRVFYRELIGPIPEGHVLHHECRVKPCVNPEHLRPMTQKEHMRLDNPNAQKTHCKRGHSFANHGFVDSQGFRQCRVCVKATGRRHYLQSKKKAGTITPEQREELAGLGREHRC